ncbi:hypothetical protein GOBAR_DD09843 [Gossypium barbadense]|nr:hypothetical protein GOBAR_DD09843 [Gossypium barbadense]
MEEPKNICAMVGRYSNLATQQIAPLAIPLDFYLPRSDEFKANAITFAAYCNSFRETDYGFVLDEDDGSLVKGFWQAKKKAANMVSWFSWLSRQSNTLKVSGSSPGDARIKGNSVWSLAILKRWWELGSIVPHHHGPIPHL